MKKKERLIIEQEAAKGHLAKAALIFLDGFLEEQREKTIAMIENGEDTKADLVIADLRALSRVANTLADCVKMGEEAEKRLKGNEKNDD